MKRFFIFPLLLLLCSFSNKEVVGYKIGDSVAAFALINIDNKEVRLSDYQANKGLIVVFTCNHCPFAKKYQDRLKSLQAKYAKEGFPLIAISSNDVTVTPEDNQENMRIRSQQEKYNFPYLYDEKQTVAKAFGASKTPHAFLLVREKNSWVVRYSGAIDDNGAEPEKVTHHYIEEAIKSTVSGKEIAIKETKSIGCAIKWKS